MTTETTYKNLTREQQLALFEENMALACYIVSLTYKLDDKSYYEDAVQVAYEGLWNGILSLDKYNPSKGALSTYLGRSVEFSLKPFMLILSNRSGLSASYHTMGNVWKKLRGDESSVSDESCQRLTARSNSLYAPVDNGKGDSAELSEFIVGDEDISSDDLLADIVRKMLSELTPYYYHLVEQYYGIGCERESSCELGTLYGVSATTIQNHLKKALEELRGMPGVSSLAVYLD